MLEEIMACVMVVFIFVYFILKYIFDKWDDGE